MAVKNIPGYKYLIKRSGRTYLLIILLVFVLGIALSVANWHIQKTRSYNDAVTKYNQQLNQSKSIITSSISQYAQLLDDGSSFLNVNSNNVTQSQWLTFFQSYDFNDNYPAVDSVNFAEYVTASGLPNYLSNLANQGQTNFSITPSGNRSNYVPITYIGYVSPVSLEALGLDQLTNPVRKAAVLEALNSGQVSMSGKIISQAVHKGQPTFLIYKPIYSSPANSISERQSNIFGFVYVAVDSNTLFNTLLSKYVTNDTAIQIYDGDINSSNLIYETGDFSSRLKNIANPVYSTVSSNFGGRT
jgi:CHASE1-domain containing sensor protein